MNTEIYEEFQNGFKLTNSRKKLWENENLLNLYSFQTCVGPIKKKSINERPERNKYARHQNVNKDHERIKWNYKYRINKSREKGRSKK